jgi:hypothetical protein
LELKRKPLPVSPSFDTFRENAHCGFKDEKSYGNSIGQTHGMKILLFTGMFLALREAFYAVTLNNLPRQQEEKLFYPFAAVTELVAVLTFLIPGLVPPKHELPR